LSQGSAEWQAKSNCSREGIPPGTNENVPGFGRPSGTGVYDVRYPRVSLRFTLGYSPRSLRELGGLIDTACVAYGFILRADPSAALMAPCAINFAQDDKVGTRLGVKKNKADPAAPEARPEHFATRGLPDSCRHAQP